MLVGASEGSVAAGVGGGSGASPAAASDELVDQLTLFSGVLRFIGQHQSQRRGRGAAWWAVWRSLLCLMQLVEGCINAGFTYYMQEQNYIGYSSSLLWLMTLGWALTMGQTVGRLHEMLRPSNLTAVHRDTAHMVRVSVLLSLASMAGQWYLAFGGATGVRLPGWFFWPWLVNTSLALNTFG